MLKWPECVWDVKTQNRKSRRFNSTRKLKVHKDHSLDTGVMHSPAKAA